MFRDGGGLADRLREEPTKEINEFLGSLPFDAHFLSSIVSWHVNGSFYKMHVNANAFVNEKLRHVLAHASKCTCGDIKPGQKVLCIYKNERCVLVYTKHVAGKCPHVKRLLDEFQLLLKERGK